MYICAQTDQPQLSDIIFTFLALLL